MTIAAKAAAPHRRAHARQRIAQALLRGVVLAAAVCSCVSPAPTVPPAGPSLAEWRAARARLSDLRRRSEGAGRRTLRISMKIRLPHAAQPLEARGAVAIDPPHALRMILLGPGGTTALDLWVYQDRFRFAIPALDLLRRGDARTPRATMRGLPVDFLRWWLLRPASGKLVWHVSQPDADRFFLRDGQALIDLCETREGTIIARRSSWIGGPTEPAAGGRASSSRLAGEEMVVAGGIGCVPVRYRQVSTGLDIAIRCEAQASDPPNPRAFVDPDAPAAAGEAR